MSTAARVRSWAQKHARFSILFLLEGVFLLFLLVTAFRPLAQITVPLERTGRVASQLQIPVEGEVPAGGYRITVQYACDAPQDTERSAPQAVGTLLFTSAGNPAAVRSDAITLTDVHSTVTARLWVATGNTVGDLLMTAAPAEGCTLTLQSVTLEEQPVWRVTSLSGWLALLAAADLALWLLFAGGAPRRPRCGWGVALLLIGGIALASLPYCADFLYSGHDLKFHTYRIWAAAQALADGQFPVRIASAGYNGYGSAAPLYYCDLFLYLPALLYNAFVPLQVCYQIYAALVNAATMLLAYYSFARMGRNRLYGAAAAFAYTLCAYRLTNLLLRASVGEYTAMAFLPLVVLGAWAIAGEERPAARDWLPLAIGMAGIVQSHLLTTELAALFLALFWLWHLPRMLRPGRLLAALKAVAVAAGLSAWFLLPCLDTMQNEYNMMSDIHPSPIQSTGAYLIQILGLFGAPSGGSGPGTAGDMPLTLGLAGTLVLVLAVWCCLRRGCWQQDATAARRARWLGEGLAFCLLAVWLSSTLFPWDWLGAHLPQKLVDILLKPQFSWRYLAVASALLGALAVWGLGLVHSWKPRLAQGAALALAAATLLYMGAFYRDYAYEHGTITMIGTETAADFPYESMGYEYLPAGTDLAIFRQTEAAAQDPSVTAVWQGGGALLCENPTGDSTAVDLPLLAYRHYTARDAATGELLPLEKNEQNCLRVTVPAGYSGTVQVTFTPPVLWRGAETVTLLTLLLLAAWALRTGRRRPQRKHSTQEGPVCTTI